MVTNGGEEVMSAYSEVNWAEELGIDVVRLEEERFGSFTDEMVQMAIGSLNAQDPV